MMPKPSSLHLSSNLQQLVQWIRNQQSHPTGKAPVKLVLGRKLRHELGTAREKLDEPPPTLQDTTFIVGSHVAAPMCGRGNGWMPGRIEKGRGPRNYLLKTDTKISSASPRGPPADNLLFEFLHIESLLDNRAVVVEPLYSTVPGPLATKKHRLIAQSRPSTRSERTVATRRTLSERRPQKILETATATETLWL